MALPTAAAAEEGSQRARSDLLAGARRAAPGASALAHRDLRETAARPPRDRRATAARPQVLSAERDGSLAPYTPRALLVATLPSLASSDPPSLASAAGAAGPPPREPTSLPAPADGADAEKARRATMGMAALADPGPVVVRRGPRGRDAAGEMERVLLAKLRERIAAERL